MSDPYLGTRTLMRAEIDALDRARRGFLAQMRTMTERQLAELQAAEQAPSPVSLPASDALDSGKRSSWMDAKVVDGE